MSPTLRGAAAMQQVSDWLEKLGLGQYAQRFAENDISFSVLPDLTDQHLKEIGVSLGHRHAAQVGLDMRRPGQAGVVASESQPRAVAREAPERAVGGVEPILQSRRGRALASGSIRAESAVEPTRSENITVTWRRSAMSRETVGASAASPAFGVSFDGSSAIARRS
jgi:SAM domain (Sterile alpha motif)